SMRVGRSGQLTRARGVAARTLSASHSRVAATSRAHLPDVTRPRSADAGLADVGPRTAVPVVARAAVCAAGVVQIPHASEVPSLEGLCHPCSHELSVRLADQREGLVLPGPYGGRDHAVRAEGPVEASIRLVPREGEVVLRLDGVARDHQLPVRLDDEA